MESTLFTELALTEQEVISGGTTQTNSISLTFDFSQSNTNTDS